MELISSSTQFLSSAPAIGQLLLHNCLFGGSDAVLCSYNPSAPTVYFSLGDAIAGGGLLLAASQLLNTASKIVLKIRPWWQRSAHWLLASTGFICVLFASIIPQLPVLNYGPILYPITYEILGAILFAASPVALLFLAKPRPNLFNNSNAARFEHSIMIETARSTDETLQAVVHIVFLNLEKILKTAETYPKLNQPEPGQLEPVHYANNILITVFSNQKFVDYVCTNRRDFLHVYLYLINSKNVGTDLEFPYHAIAKSLFANKNSYLYTQYEAKHVLGEHSLYKNIFYEQRSLSMNPLQDWFHTRSDENDDYLNYQFLEVYLAALENSLQGYLDSRILNASRSVIAGFRSLVSSIGASYCQSLLYKSSNNDLRGVISSRLTHVGHFLGSTIFYEFHEAYLEKKISDDYLISLKRDREYDDVVVAYVRAMYGYLEIISRIDTSLPGGGRDHAVGLTINFFIIDNDNSFSKKIFELFTGYVWDKIRENVDRGTYPNILGLYISMIGFKTSDDPDSQFNQERNKLVNFMYSELAPKILAGALMMNNTEKMEKVFLPKEVVFNRDTQKFEYHTSHTIQIMEKV